MVKSLTQTGVMQVNGAWATSLKYESEVLGARAGTVDLRFMQGRSEVARVSLLVEELAEVIGDRNAASIARHLATDADKYLAVVKGELRGTRLQYQAVRLEENAIEQARLKMNDANLEGPTASANPAEVVTTAPSSKAEKSTRAGSIDARSADVEGRAPETLGRRQPVPQHIVAKYLVKNDKYYFDDQTVAFVDRGSRLTVQTQNSAVIKDLIEIAESRGWQQIAVTGSQSFKREAWREAYASGLEASGYSPSAIELEAANRARSRRGETHAQSVPDGSPDKPVACADVQSRDIAPMPRSAGSRRGPDPSRDMVYGTLLDHGVAPYRNDASKSASYFVTLKDEVGVERTHWGVGLADAMRHAQSTPAIGQEIGIRRIGSTAVTVVQRDGPEGKAAPTPIAAKRHQWLIETAEFLKGNPQAQDKTRSPAPSYLKETQSVVSTERKPAAGMSVALTPSQEAAAAVRSAETTREELQLKYPEINKAVFQHLASHDQFAEAYVKAGLIRDTDRARVIAQMRERLAARLEHGGLIQEPNNQEVNALIRRSVDRAAADIGRPTVEIRNISQVAVPALRDEAQVRA